MKVKKNNKSCIFYDQDNGNGCVFLDISCQNKPGDHKVCDYFDSGIVSLTSKEIDAIVDIMKNSKPSTAKRIVKKKNKATKKQRQWNNRSVL
ncbi:MAG: hypothetical protein PHY56_00955 [Candidatus Omnitrophica bacterium]|nr:hypothetical protein [Candidatus Omnitrophota bacterium]